MALPIAAAFIVTASYAGCDRALVITMFVVSNTLVGSVMTDSLDQSPNYAGAMMALINQMVSLTGIIGIIGILTTDQTLTEWRYVFWIMFGVATFCNLIFLTAVVIAMFAVSMTFKGVAYPSVMTDSLDVSPNYAGLVIALTNGLAALTGIAGPYFIGILTPSQALSEWRLVFLIIFVVTSFCNLIFLLYGSGEVQFWNNPDFVQIEMNEKDKQKSDNQRRDTIENETDVFLL